MNIPASPQIPNPPAGAQPVNPPGPVEPAQPVPAAGNEAPNDVIKPLVARYGDQIVREALIKDFNIPEERILVEGIARHSTTNLRNAGRMMLDHGLTQGVIVSDPGFMGMVSQSDYFNMVFFNLRYLNNHGQWSPGEITPVDDHPLGIGDRHNAFVPNPGVRKRDEVNDPLDP